jgi:formate C-acetyltransferase
VRLANGVSPADCADSLAITQTMNSVSRLNPKYYVNGYTFNQKVDPPLMEDARLFAGLLRAFFKQNHKGVQIQFNVIDEAILKAARAHPEKYPWLVVRVSGYSAYFKDLSAQMQDEIIQRAAKKG